MSVEMPQWCGRCHPTTRRFDLGDSERRCPECNPFWSFGHSSVDPARVPTGHAEQELAAKWLLYEVVGLRSLQPAELRRRTRRFFDAGWTPLDVLHALDNDPDGSPSRSVPLPGDAPDRMERQILNLLTAWCDADGEPLPSPTQAAIRRRERMHKRQRAQQEAWAQLAARPIDPDAAQRSGARQAAALATRRAQEMRVEARRREKVVRAASVELARSQQAKVAALMERLDRLTRSITSPQRAWEADWAIAPRDAWTDADNREADSRDAGRSARAGYDDRDADSRDAVGRRADADAEWAIAPRDAWTDADNREADSRDAEGRKDGADAGRHTIWADAGGRTADTWTADRGENEHEDERERRAAHSDGRAREALLLHDIEPYFSSVACEEDAAEPTPAVFACEAEIDDTVPLREAGLRMIRARRDGDEVTPSAAENETAVGRSLWTSVRGSTGMSAGRSGGRRRAA